MRLSLLLAAVCVLAGCRTGKGDPVDVATIRVEQALMKSVKTSTQSGPAELRVRYNPAPCDCPPYEVFAYGRWMRAFIDGDSPAVAALQNADALATATLVGVLESQPRPGDNGVMYAVVTMNSVK